MRSAWNKGCGVVGFSKVHGDVRPLFAVSSSGPGQTEPHLGLSTGVCKIRAPRLRLDPLANARVPRSVNQAWSFPGNSTW